MTEDCRIIINNCIVTTIYVFLHIKSSDKVFHSNRRLTEDSGEEDKL